MKQTIKNYSFNASAKTVTFTDFSSIDIDRLYLITNVTSNIVIYQFNNNALGGSSSTNVLTLTYNTGSMSNTDHLQIIYDCTVGDPDYDNTVAIQGVSGGTPIPVSGTITSTPCGTQTISGTVTATQSTGTNLHTVVDSGSITANAGTNLNTSALALESGGNLATVAANTGNLIMPFIDKAYDYVGMSNPDSNGNYQTIVFKVGGSGGTTAVTLTLTFDGNSNVTSITRT